MKTKKFFVAAALGTIATTCLASCGGSKKLDMDNWKFTPKDASNIKIGILQPLEHAALSAAREGFIAGLKASGYEESKNITIKYQNANGVEADLNTLAKSLTSSSDLTLGIGTGASKALYSAQINSGSTNPILFTAVTDAVAA
ncbi:MAG: ABC transporter substrate binding protein, partial [Bacilli bacterium]|nr:ABC transporter substrate binding protein [Bacilli bacterium]